MVCGRNFRSGVYTMSRFHFLNVWMFYVVAWSLTLVFSFQANTTREKKIKGRMTSKSFCILIDSAVRLLLLLAIAECRSLPYFSIRLNTKPPGTIWFCCYFDFINSSILLRTHGFQWKMLWIHLFGSCPATCPTLSSLQILQNVSDLYIKKKSA